MLELDQKSLSDFNNIILKPSETVIIMHMNPDADALCSSLGLSGFLEQKGHTVTVISPTEIPDYLKWVKDVEKVIIFKNFPDKAKEAIEFAGNILMVDFSHFSRIGNELADLVQDSAANKMVLDHHIDPYYDMADTFLHSTDAAAAAELIATALIDLGFYEEISSDVATQFYTGIVTDTGSFRHGSTTANSHYIASYLISLGADITPVHKNLHENSTYEKVKFLGYMLLEKFVFIKENNIGYAIVNEADFKKFSATYDDIESIISLAMSIESLKLFVIAKQNNEIYKISLRSKGELDCTKIANELFAGGGHVNASGGIYNGPAETLTEIIQSIPIEMYKTLNEKVSLPS